MHRVLLFQEGTKAEGPKSPSKISTTPQGKENREGGLAGGSTDQVRELFQEFS